MVTSKILENVGRHWFYLIALIKPLNPHLLKIALIPKVKKMLIYSAGYLRMIQIETITK